MRDTYCAFFSGRCEDVCCNNCPDKPTAYIPNDPNVHYYTPVKDEWPNIDHEAPEHEHRLGPRLEGGEVPVRWRSEAPDSAAVDAFMQPDNVMHPAHYARWKMEPIEFIALNNLPWWLANVIKYTMRFDAKDGLQDLYKARSYLEMKIREVEGEQRFWDKPVAEERKLNGIV